MNQQLDNLLGQSNHFLEVIEHVSKIAPLSKPVLIIGERGTGKELIAERLHYLSQRWDQTFLKLNCAALPESILESELFGHEAGSFTGASKRRMGRFEAANNGTLFLDELANTSTLVQEKLLRVIEYGQFERVGGNQTVDVDVRLIAATNEDLPSLAASGKFRADLLDRLAFDVITLPPLRERRDDIMLLAEYFAVNMARQLGQPLFPGFIRSVKAQLEDYHWPGNIRELKNAIERSVYRHDDPHNPVETVVFDPFDSPFRPVSSVRYKESEPRTTEAVRIDKSHSPSQPDYPFSLKQVLQDYEIKLIQTTLEEHQFNQKRTAEALQLTYHQLRGILKKYNLLDTNGLDEKDA